MEKLIILTGSLVGTMRVRTEKQGTSVEILLRKGGPGAYTAYLVDGRGTLCAVTLDASLKGSVSRPFDVHAALLALDTPRGAEFAAEGGFIGRAKLLEEAKRDVRIRRTALTPLNGEPRAASVMPVPGGGEKMPAPQKPAVFPAPNAQNITSGPAKPHAAAASDNRIAQKSPGLESAEQARIYSAGNAEGAFGEKERLYSAGNAAEAFDEKERLYSAGSAADAIGEQARLTKEYAGANAREEAAADAFRAAEEPERPRALDEILKTADELFRPLDAQFAIGASGPSAENAVYNPFPDAFPASRWKKVNYPGTNRFYLEGEMEQNGMRMVLHALPGEYAPVSPMRRRGFTRFFRAADGSGYWVRVQRR